MSLLLVKSHNLEPSGLALEAVSAVTLPLAPGRFSTITDWPNAWGHLEEGEAPTHPLHWGTPLGLGIYGIHRWI